MSLNVQFIFYLIFSVDMGSSVSCLSVYICETFGVFDSCEVLLSMR